MTEAASTNLEYGFGSINLNRVDFDYDGLLRKYSRLKTLLLGESKNKLERTMNYITFF